MPTKKTARKSVKKVSAIKKKGKVVKKTKLKPKAAKKPTPKKKYGLKDAVKDIGHGVAHKVARNTGRKAGLGTSGRTVVDKKTGRRRRVPGMRGKTNKEIIKDAFNERAAKRTGGRVTNAASRLTSAAKTAVKGKRGGISYKNGKVTRQSAAEANRQSAKRKAQRAEAAGRAGGRPFREIGKLRQTGSWRDRWGGGHWAGEGKGGGQRRASDVRSKLSKKSMKKKK